MLTRMHQLLAAAAVALSCAVLAPSAAAWSIDTLAAGPTSTYHLPSGLPETRPGEAPSSVDPCALPGGLTLAPQAGATTDYCVALQLAPRDPVSGVDLESLTVELPPQTVLDVARQAGCDPAAFARAATSPAGCLPGSQIGTALLAASTASGIDVRLPGRIFALATPTPSLGLEVATAPRTSSVAKIVLTPSTLPDTRTVLASDAFPTGIPSEGGELPIAITYLSLRLWGRPSEHPRTIDPVAAPVMMAAPLVRLGRSCAQMQVVRVAATAVGNAAPAIAAQTSFPLSGCAALPADETGVPASVGAPRGSNLQALPPLVPLFGTTRARKAGQRIGSLRLVRLTGLPIGTRVTVRCTAGCDRRRQFTLRIRRAGNNDQQLGQGWPLRRTTRLRITARAPGYATLTRRVGFTRAEDGVFGRFLP